MTVGSLSDCRLTKMDISCDMVKETHIRAVTKRKLDEGQWHNTSGN
jgi:hypothetical protein